MNDRTDLLVEIGTEELPPTALKRLEEAFCEGFVKQLHHNRIAHHEVESYATPRRLALVISGIATRQPDQAISRKGPALAAAYAADGSPTKAAEGFARSCGVAVSALDREESAKGTWLVFRSVSAGAATADLLIPMVERALGELPIPKRMRWGDREDQFVRPVHWVTLLLGSEVVPGRMFGLEIGRETRGHRFHHPQAIPITAASEYAECLRSQGFVEPSFSKRRESIQRQVEELADQAGGKAALDANLLDEVTALCEWPTAMIGSFDQEFLEVPAEALVETMQKNQKYFPVHSASGQLLPRFITVSNIRSQDPEQVRAGNERVIRPRFADAAFFWGQDLKKPFDHYARKLTQVVFQEKLGTVAEKSARVAQISRHLAGLLGADEELCARSAYLAKCDLVTQMIAEFPGLQGIMGRYYAERSGEDPCVSAAMEEQYLPRHAGDRLPQTDCGRILSVADRLDTLIGIFSIGQRPTGVKDPYALRRATIGLLRILIETPLPLDLREVLEFAAQELRDKVTVGDTAAEVFEYALERLKGYYQDLGVGNDVVDAVLAVDATVPSDIHLRILAVNEFRTLAAAESLTAANKRTRNILRKSEELGVLPNDPNTDALVEESEKRLAARLAALKDRVAPLLAQQDYTGVLTTLASLREDIDTFFDEVMVNVEDVELRRNRLALLRSLESMFVGVADIARLQ
jgi:glycyl-tRNA synthetase beta chain